jgi:hypothetical protein
VELASFTLINVALASGPPVNSAADWGVSDALKVPKTATRMRHEGIGENDILKVVWDNPITFFEQSGRLDRAELERATGVDQRQLFEGNSILRGGQSPTVD